MTGGCNDCRWHIHSECHWSGCKSFCQEHLWATKDIDYHKYDAGCKKWRRRR
jgi:hypothetical protein